MCKVWYFPQVFDVESCPNPINVAYSDVALGLHTDLAYYESPPGLQLLHCLRHVSLPPHNTLSPLSIVTSITRSILQRLSFTHSPVLTVYSVTSPSFLLSISLRAPSIIYHLLIHPSIHPTIHPYIHPTIHTSI